jgi:enoyl-CoA hydratase
VSEIRLSVADGVATITLVAPARRNALTESLARELIEACDTVDANPAIGAAVISGEGGFCAGAARELLAAATADPMGEPIRASLQAIYESFVRVGELGVPSIAAVTGAAVGAGVNLALATDLRIVAMDARIFPGFLRLRVHPGGGHFTLLGRLTSREAVAALGMFGEEIDGHRAHELGIAWEAVAEQDVLPRAQMLAARVARDPELARAMASSLRLELGPPPVSWRAALQAESAAQAWSLRRLDPENFSVRIGGTQSTP